MTPPDTPSAPVAPAPPAPPSPPSPPPPPPPPPLPASPDTPDFSEGEVPDLDSEELAAVLPSREAWQAEVTGELPLEEDIPPAEPIQDSQVLPGGHIRRKLPVVKSVADRFATPRGTQLPEQTPEEAWANLQAKTSAVLDRLTKFRGLLVSKGAPDAVSPLTHNDFNSYIRDYLSYLGMSFVVFGRLPLDERGPIPGEAIQGPTSDGATGAIPATPGQNEKQQIDPALLGNSAAQAAIAAGIDLTSDDDYGSDE